VSRFGVTLALSDERREARGIERPDPAYAGGSGKLTA
jgi:hypothetical protein